MDDQPEISHHQTSAEKRHEIPEVVCDPAADPSAIEIQLDERPVDVHSSPQPSPIAQTTDSVVQEQPVHSPKPQQQLASPPTPQQHHKTPMVVQAQPVPQQMSWMPVPPMAIPGCPPGLEYLTMLDQLLVRQTMDVLELFTNWETENRYVVYNSMGQQAYYAFEDSGFCQRMFCGPMREFTMHIVDNMNQEVMRVYRPFKCTCGGCCGCCLKCQHEIVVEAPVGTPIGFAVQQRFCCIPSFLILDSERNPVFRIEGPSCIMCPCFRDLEFNVNNVSGENVNVGKITKQWAGILQENFTDASNFGISFPIDMDVRMKATFLGVLFLIDFMFFEQSKNKKEDNVGLRFLGFAGQRGPHPQPRQQQIVIQTPNFHVNEAYHFHHEQGQQQQASELQTSFSTNTQHTSQSAEFSVYT